MIKADEYYIQNLIELESSGIMDKNPRPKYKDGTPAHCKYITQVFEKYDISKGEFPITTLRNTAVKTGIKEVLWIYQSQTSSLEKAEKMGISWWNEWDIGDGTIGQRYGATVSKWGLMEQLLFGLEHDPFSRRHIVNLLQESDLRETKGLYPCAYETLWSVREIDGVMFLDMTLVQRSNDYIMAGYINKIQYVALLMMVCGHLGYEPGVFCHMTQNLHVYDRHMGAVEELLQREPLLKQPKLILKERKNFFEYTIDDFVVENVDGIRKIKSELEIAI